MENPSKEKPLLLIVDDLPRNLQVMGAVLKEDYRINLADSGPKAIEMVEKNSPDLILLDIMMPDMDGFETCLALKRMPEYRDIPVIFLTARTQTEDIVRGFEAGAVDYVTKPFNALELKVRINNHIQLRRKTLALQSLSEMDGLTMIPNRRRFEAFLDAEWRRCLRNGRTISLLMIDIDFFKLYNDFYGHLAGDECLKTVARSIAECVQRPGDLAARFGGEEFAVVLSDTALTAARTLAERIDLTVKALYLPHERSPIAGNLTLSIGISGVVPEMGLNPAQLVQRADEALYSAKESGRDRIEALPLIKKDFPADKGW